MAEHYLTPKQDAISCLLNSVHRVEGLALEFAGKDPHYAAFASATGRYVARALELLEKDEADLDVDPKSLFPWPDEEVPK